MLRRRRPSRRGGVVGDDTDPRGGEVRSTQGTETGVNIVEEPRLPEILSALVALSDGHEMTDFDGDGGHRNAIRSIVEPCHGH